MAEMIEAVQKVCPQCRDAADIDARFCKYCAFDFIGSNTNTETKATEAKTRRKYKTDLYVLGILVAVMLIIVVGFIVLKLSNRSSQISSVVENSNTNSTPPNLAYPALSAKAQQVEEKILRGEALSVSNIEGISIAELRLLRNAHFARYGRRYTQPELNNYFQSRSWYKPSDSYNDSMLTSTDRDNVKLILSIEKPEITNSNSSQDDSSSSSSVESSSNTSSSSSSLEIVALQKGKAHFEQYFTKCGSNYIVGNPRISEIYWYRDVSFSAERQSDAETDRINGIEYNGKLLASARYKRNSWGSGSGGGYKDWQPYNSTFASVRLTKRKGQDWDIVISGSLLYRKMQCSEIPSGVPQ